MVILRIYRNHSTDDIMYQVCDTSNEGLPSYQIEKGDFDPSYLSEIINDHPAIQLVVIPANTKLDQHMYQPIKDACIVADVKYHDNNG